MFDMSQEQMAAFQSGTNGMSAITFCHLILFLIGAAATVWLFLIFSGTIKSKKRSLYESIYEFAFAVGIYSVIGVVIYYT